MQTHQTGTSHLTEGQAIWKHEEVFLLFTHTQLGGRRSDTGENAWQQEGSSAGIRYQISC